MKGVLLSILAALALATAVNAQRGDLMPVRYTVTRSTEATILWIEWKLEPWHEYAIQQSRDLIHWETVQAFVSAEWDLLGGQLDVMPGETLFLRVIDNDSF